MFKRLSGLWVRAFSSLVQALRGHWCSIGGVDGDHHPVHFLQGLHFRILGFRRWSELFATQHHVGFPKIGRTFLGVPIIRIAIFWGLYWGPHYFGTLYIGIASKSFLGCIGRF